MMEQSSGHAARAEVVAGCRVSEQLQKEMVQSQPACALVRKKPAGARKEKALSTQFQKKPACSKKRVAQQGQTARGRGCKAAVFCGNKQKTPSGLTKADLVRNTQGKVVSKRKSQMARVGNIGRWGDAVKESRRELGIVGFCPVGGRTEQGKALYALAAMNLRLHS
jgi:hypothetical protein